MTPQQALCLQVVKDLITPEGVAPSFDEIRARMGLASKSRVYDLLHALEAHGKVRFVRGRARSIEIVDEVPDRARMSMAALRERIALDQAELAARTHGRGH